MYALESDIFCRWIFTSLLVVTSSLEECIEVHTSSLNQVKLTKNAPKKKSIKKCRYEEFIHDAHFTCQRFRVLGQVYLNPYSFFWDLDPNLSQIIGSENIGPDLNPVTITGSMSPNYFSYEKLFCSMITWITTFQRQIIKFRKCDI